MSERLDWTSTMELFLKTKIDPIPDLNGDGVERFPPEANAVEEQHDHGLHVDYGWQEAQHPQLESVLLFWEWWSAMIFNDGLEDSNDPTILWFGGCPSGPLGCECDCEACADGALDHQPEPGEWWRLRLTDDGVIDVPVGDYFLGDDAAPMVPGNFRGWCFAREVAGFRAAMEAAYLESAASLAAFARSAESLRQNA